MNNKQIYFPYYSGNIRFSKCQGYVSLDYFIKRHKTPKKHTLKTLKQVRVADDLNLSKLKRKLKHNLFSFTPSVIIPKTFKRNYKNIVSYTGLMQLDFDKIENENIAIDLKNHLFNDYKEIVVAYLSPSKLGVKCLLKITKPKNKEHYKAIHKAVTDNFGGIVYFDEATKNAVLPLFLSYDPNILFRDYSKCKTFTDENWSKPNYVSLNNKPNLSNENQDYYNKKTHRIFVNKIRAIVDNGHPQLRSACLILGSRVSAGYIDEIEAKNLAYNMVNENKYFHKDLKNYLSTADWAIQQGKKSPKYY